MGTLCLLYACSSDEPSKGAPDARLPLADASALVDGGQLARDAGRDGGRPPSALDGSRPSDDGAAPALPDGALAPALVDAASELDARGPDASEAAAQPDGGSAVSESATPDAGPALESFVYVGGWDWESPTYPYRSYRLDRSSGALDEIDNTREVGANPSFATPSADGRFLYISNESDGADGLTVAAVDATTGLLRVLEREAWQRPGASVFASIDPSGKFLLAANYDGGEVMVHRLEDDGKLSAIVDSEPFGVDAQTHSIRVHPSGRFAYAPNKAHDTIAQLRFDSATGELAPNEVDALLETSADEPRHLAFTPDGALAYVSYEAGNALGAYRVEDNGTLTELQVESTLPGDYAGDSKGAHVLVHPSGKFVYASNRGHDSIAVFAIADDGKVSLLEHEPSRGKTPRNFDIDSTGRLLVVANQGDDGATNGGVVVFSIASDGKLAHLDEVGGLPSANSIAIVTRAKP